MEDKIKNAIININNEVGVIVKHECANITTRIQVMLHELLKVYADEMSIIKKELEDIKKELATPDENQA